MTAPAVVKDCSLCDGRGALQGERVPSGAERTAGIARGQVLGFRCPRCAGRSAHLTGPDVPGSPSEAVPPVAVDLAMKAVGGTATDNSCPCGVGVGPAT